MARKTPVMPTAIQARFERPLKTNSQATSAAQAKAKK